MLDKTTKLLVEHARRVLLLLVCRTPGRQHRSMRTRMGDLGRDGGVPCAEPELHPHAEIRYRSRCTPSTLLENRHPLPSEIEAEVVEVKQLVFLKQFGGNVNSSLALTLALTHTPTRKRQRPCRPSTQFQPHPPCNTAIPRPTSNPLRYQPHALRTDTRTSRHVRGFYFVLHWEDPLPLLPPSSYSDEVVRAVGDTLQSQQRGARSVRTCPALLTQSHGCCCCCCWWTRNALTPLGVVPDT